MQHKNTFSIMRKKKKYQSKTGELQTDSFPIWRESFRVQKSLLLKKIQRF